MDDGAISVTTITERNGEPFPVLRPSTVRYSFFVELPAQPERGLSWSYQYDSDAVQELESLEPGDTVEIPATSVMEYWDRSNRVEDVHRVTHEGCSEVEIMGAQTLVHTLRFDAFNQFIRGSEPRTHRLTVVREYAPSFGWWVAERDPTMGSVVLVETSS